MRAPNSRSELYRHALRKFLAEHSDGAVTASLNEVYPTDPVASQLDPELVRLQAASLAAEDW